MNQRQQTSRTDGFLGQPRNDGQAPRVALPNDADLAQLTRDPLPEERIAGCLPRQGCC